LCCSLGVSAPAQTVSAPPALWPELRQQWERGQTHLPARMVIRTEELGKTAETVSREEREYTLSYPRGPGDPDSLLVRAVKDGQDITARERKKNTRRRESDEFPDGNPLAAEVQGLLEWPDSGLEADGRLVPYRIRYQKRAVAGVLRINNPGEPPAFSYSYEPLPAMVHQFDVDATLRSLRDGSLVVGSLSFTVQGTLLFIKKHYRITMEFSDFPGE